MASDVRLKPDYSPQVGTGCANLQIATDFGRNSPKRPVPESGLCAFARAPGILRRKRAARLRGQMPAYHAYPPSGDAEPRPLPNRFRLSLMVRRVMYLTLL